jgi:hypothetical protein
MRTLLAVSLACCFAGCGEAELPVPSSPPRKVVDAKKLAEAKQQFSAFLDEATGGAALLESHPEREAMERQIKVLEDLLQRASRVYPAHEKMAELAEEGRDMLKYFDACVGIAKMQSQRKDTAAEDAKKRVAWTCDENARAVRQLVDRMKYTLEP